MNNETNPLREESELDLIKTLESIRNNTYDLFGGRKDTWYKSYLKNLTDAGLKVVRQSQSLPAEQPEKNKRSIKEDFIYWLEGVLTYNIDDGLREQLEAKLDMLSQQPSQPEGKTAEQVADMYWMDRQKFVKEIEKYAKEYANQPRKEWISVTDPPKEPGRYLCVVEEQGDLGLSRFVWNCSYSERHGFMDNLQEVKVTHWMPLPNLPTPPQK